MARAAKTILLLGALLRLTAASAASLQVEITPRFHGQPLALDSMRYENSAGENFSVTRVSWLASGFALQCADGSWLELTNRTAWFDAERGRNSFRLENLPPENFRSLRFSVGLDESTNTNNPAQYAADHPLNPNLNGLHWSWQGGYIFLALEGLWRNPVAAARQSAATVFDGWSYHLARSPNSTRIVLAAPLDLVRDTRLNLDFDLGTLLNAPRPLSFGKDGSSTHSRPGDAIAAALVANLPGAFSVKRVSAMMAVEAAVADSKPLYLPEKFTPYRFQMSAMFPIPDLPRDNPLIEERVALGEKLFSETALSKDGTLSCTSCHKANAAFADPRRVSLGVRNQAGTRNAMPLVNLAWKSSFFWDGRAPSLRAQALLPIQDHTEMDETLTNVVAKLSSSRRKEAQLSQSAIGNRQSAMDVSLLTSAATNETDYPALFTAAFGSPEITAEKIGLAVEQFVLTLTSFDSQFDRALRGEGKLSAEEQRGFELFMTEYDPRREQFGADCFHCHGGPLFQSQTFANNGLDSAFADPGRAKITGKDADAGKFATPSLRNIALTAPYMHDGRFATLEEVVEHYTSGMKRSATLDPNLAKHPDGGVPLAAADKRALLAFLKTLTDEMRFRSVP